MVYVVQHRVIRLSKGVFSETYTIIEFTFEPSVEYHSFKLTSGLSLTRKEVLFILENLKLIRKLHDNISKTLFIA